MRIITLSLALLFAGSLIFPISGFCASQPAPPGTTSFNQALDDMDAPVETGAGTVHPAAHIIQGRVLSTAAGAHDTEGVLRIQPEANNGMQSTGLAIDVPSNTFIQRSDEVEKASGETGIAFFHHIHIGDIVAVAYNEAKDASDVTAQNVADKIEILYRG